MYQMVDGKWNCSTQGLAIVTKKDYETSFKIVEENSEKVYSVERVVPLHNLTKQLFIFANGSVSRFTNFEYSYTFQGNVSIFVSN